MTSNFRASTRHPLGVALLVAFVGACSSTTTTPEGTDADSADAVGGSDGGVDRFDVDDPTEDIVAAPDTDADPGTDDADQDSGPADVEDDTSSPDTADDATEADAVYDAGDGSGSGLDADDATELDATDSEDADALTDAAGDVETDAAPDVAIDAGPDASPDVATDAGPDVGADATLDVLYDVGMDAATDVGVDASPDVTADAVVDASTDTATDAVVDTSPDAVVDAGIDASADVGSDADTGSPELCGNGSIDAGEECDDGNDDDTDACTNACEIARCGDGIVSFVEAIETFESPLVTNPFGATGYVCDDFSGCSDTADCDVTENGNAPEHGICQSLGYERAISVNWGGGMLGSPTPHAYNWECVDFVCGPSDDERSANNCSTSEMLRDITCAGVVEEACDAGDANSNSPDASCRLDCTVARCGDGIVDSGEECDDGNDDELDACLSTCEWTVCGDGLVQGDEECDDGNLDDTDACTTLCTRPVCGDGVVTVINDRGVFTSPLVTSPSGATGRVCDDGSSCQASSCEVADDGDAPEHGICQTLGYDRAVRVRWGGGEGADDEPMPHAYNWECEDYVCTAGSDQDSSDNCSSSEMLREIECAFVVNEICDDGEANGTPASTCTTECRIVGCGDGTTAAGEECDDGNSVDSDLCSNACTSAFCGDRYVQAELGEACDEGADNGIDGGTCNADCTLVPVIPACSATELTFDGGVAGGSGSTAGQGNDTSGSCGGSGAPDQTLYFIAPVTGSYVISTEGARYDTVLYAREVPEDGSCAGSQLACNDDAPGLGSQSRITVSAEAGSTVLIVVDGYGSNSGEWNLTVTLSP